jgi:tetratricopeptide (TPR) repeat protein
VEFWLGRALEATGDERKATARFQRAVEIEPGHVLAAAHLGRRLAFGGQSREAIKMLEPLVAETEEFPFAFAVLGRAHYDAGNRAKALVFLRKARRLDPSSFEAAYWEGRIEGDANNHQAATRALAAAVEVAPDEGTQTQDAWRRLGRAYAALGRNDAARSAFRKYLEIAPPDAAGRAEAQRKLRDL